MHLVNEVLQREEIKAKLPYGDDFLFIDSATIISEKEIETSYHYHTRDLIIASHFENGPSIVPGVIIAEQICQSALLLAHYNPYFNNPNLGYLGRLKSSFHAPAVCSPSAEIKVIMRYNKLMNGTAAFTGEAYQGDTLLVKANAISIQVEES